MDLSFLHENYGNDAAYSEVFQSLFLWIFRSYLVNILFIVLVIIQFQSLFLWIFRSYRKRRVQNG